MKKNENKRKVKKEGIKDREKVARTMKVTE
jgi:hypothetical protein